MKSTPGPWDWIAVGANASGGHHLYIVDADNRKIAAIWGKAEEKEANARLIAVLPDLLAAAKNVCWFDWSTNDTDAVLAIQLLRQAIAKAEAAG